MDLAKKKCVPCEGGVKPFTAEESRRYLKEIKRWKLVGNKLERNFNFRDFKQAMKLVNKVADIAESEGHHPDILVHSWNKVKLTIYTHAIGGLSENDFILAAKINRLV